MKGHNSVKNIGGVMVLVLYISTDIALYLYQESIIPSNISASLCSIR